MAKYLLIESRDPFESNDVGFLADLALRLRADGNEVTIFLVQNGVLPVRAGARDTGFSTLVGADVTVLADDFSLRERGISPDRLLAGVEAAPLDVVVDHLADGAKALWH
ncbi:DsrE family protein [Paraburkholderia fungorum]|jgi:hypothetical protein|uniref:DsrE/DsrF-like family protein n=1 Tax=Paraburkholderia fungorum TaxID=134537 RepID=A0AAW3V5F7_9BURK|nr:DsrE family protein [Paraburkholderia fungorum]AJZ56024.1 dsrE/DsrF-like family protein [Paraburkholderia fungorum]MBB4516567.1 intracellular sulfur oxidation DsrE/DsrF family protein [Paraburkholderia fungorum]MBB5545176.1 intracellular sulfur oxidation DsrE/DsrF family protein [Paraburkholderia fungorum]MBB6204960.1 intracellular sulfur oxidation DsrE/DsrF family protein [Paraburkholderia fungorum]MBU7440579.1 DsrE family protein [Paraburkholderia fungorum]